MCDVYLKNEIPNINNPGQTSNDVTTPDRIEKRKSLPKTPKSPFNASAKVKILVAEILFQLLQILKKGKW